MRNYLSEVILNSEDISNIAIRIINSWITGGWFTVLGGGWERSELTFSGA